MKRCVATLTLAAGVLLLASCVTNQWTEPWIEAERNRGTIEIMRTDLGFEYRYVDPGGRLLQLEKRNPAKRLLIGENVVRWKHDDEGRPVEITYYDHDYQRSPGNQGSAIVLVRHGTRNGKRYEIHTHHDVERKRVMIPVGYFKELVVYHKTVPDRVVRRIYFDLDGKPASAQLDGVENTAVIEYTYLLGVGELVYATHYDLSDSIVGKHKVSGETVSLTTQRQTTTAAPTIP
jgi:hypothetical protein